MKNKVMSLGVIAVMCVAVLSFAAVGSTPGFSSDIKIETVSPIVLEKTFNEKSKDAAGTYNVAFFEIIPNETGAYYFTDSLMSNTDATMYDVETDQAIATNMNPKKPIEILVNMEKGKKYKLEVKDYSLKKTSIISYCVVSDIKGETVFLKGETKVKKPVKKWTKIFKYDCRGNDFKTMILNYVDSKNNDTNVSSKLSVSIYDSKWKLVKNVKYEAYQNTAEQMYDIDLKPAEYYIVAEMMSDSIGDTANIAIDEAVPLTINRSKIISAAGYDLHSSASFTPIVKGTYEFYGDKRVTKMTVMKGLKSIKAVMGKSLKLKLNADTKYKIYYGMFPSSTSKLAIGVTMPVFTFTGALSNNVVANGANVRENVRIAIQNDNITSKKVYYNGKEIAVPGDNVFKKEGSYRVRGVSRLATAFTFKFSIDKTPPAITLIGYNGDIIESGSKVSGKVIVSVGRERPLKTKLLFNGKQYSWPKDATLSAKGQYKIFVEDVAGNKANASLVIK